MNYWLLAQISFKKAILTHIIFTYPDLLIKKTVLLHIAFPFAKIDANQAKIYNKILSTFWDKYQKCNFWPKFASFTQISGKQTTFLKICNPSQKLWDNTFLLFYQLFSKFHENILNFLGFMSTICGINITWTDSLALSKSRNMKVLALKVYLVENLK